MRLTIRRPVTAAALVVVAIASRSEAVTLSPVQDTDIVNGGGWENFVAGELEHISVNYSDATSVIALIEFDVSGIASSTIQNAKLRLFHDFNVSDGAFYDVHRVDSLWDELTMDYDQRPKIGDDVYSTLKVADSESGIWREWNVTLLVQEWIDGSFENYGMAIQRIPDSSPWPYFRSKDTDQPFGQPELVIRVPEPVAVELLLLGICCICSRHVSVSAVRRCLSNSSTKSRAQTIAASDATPS